MEEDIRIVKLYRQAISESNKGNRLENDNNVQHLYVTDYFTQLSVEKKELSDSFSQIVSLDKDELESEETVAAQSYVLYFSSDMMRWYENCEGKKKGHCNPFETSRRAEYPFLSIIQVHITPEILHCMENADTVLEKDNIILKPFLDDLYEIIGTYQVKNPEFVFRVYHVLSAGDFAVVIRSQSPRSSFEVSSRLRRRVAGAAGQNSRKLAMYKTYTLLAMEREIRKELIYKILHKTRDDKMLIRACYSCEYWSKLHNTEEVFSLGDSGEYMGLNGRYDFITELTMEEFFLLYPLILKCRLGEELDEKELREIENSETQKVKTMADLLRSRKISYLNERYVIGGLNTVYSGMKKEAKWTKKILLRTDWESLTELEDCTENRIDALKKRMDRSKERIKAIPEMHRNVVQYFILLENLISSCRIINRQSDTRIYARGLLEQLETVEDSLEDYLDICELVDDDDKFEFAEIFMDYLRGAVHTLDSYAEYIRNNNMQSLQTPNYNIESKMGMEKLLIGYSEYLRQYIQNYKQGLTALGIEQDSGKKFYPVIIPDLNRTDIGVEALFPKCGVKDEGTGAEAGAKKERKTLLVVTCSALKELSDTPVLMSILSHEAAHQFRYEDRKKRNEVILSMLVRDYAQAIAGQIVRAAKIEEEARLQIKESLQNLFQNALEEPIKRWMLKRGEDCWADMSLGAFETEYGRLLSRFISAWNYRGELKKGIKIFVKNLEREYQSDKDKLADNLEKINNILENLFEESPTEIDEIEEIEECLKAIVAAYKQGAGEEKIDEQYKDGLWNFMNIFCDMSVKHKLYNSFPKSLGADFFEEVYRRAADLWEKKNRGYQGKKDFAMLRAWNLAGRYFGLDLEGEMFREKGKSRLKNELLSVCLSEKEIGSPEVLVSRYREITSDISMCCMLRLSLFGYINLCALMMWEEVLVYKFNLTRMVTVICAMYNEEKSYDDLCVEMFDDLVAYAGKNWKGSEKGKKDFLQCMESEKPAKGEMTYSTYNGAKKILTQEKKSAQNEDVCSFLKHLRQIFLMCEKLAVKGKDTAKELEEDPKLLADYKNGVNVLRRVREILDQKNNQDTSIKKFVDLGNLINKFLKEEHYHVGNVRNKEINRASMNYLLWLYYCRKIHNAQSKACEEVETNAD